MTKPKRQPTVPYITSWSSEEEAAPEVVEDALTGGIAFRRERVGDRDEYGVLWRRSGSRPGKGQPQYARVHPYRQRHAMRHLRCQICAAPADRDDRGVLWLLHDDRGDWPNWPEQMAATHPPVCLPCAPLATRLCPHLTGHHTAVRVKNPQVVGVHGALYTPVPGSPHPRLATRMTMLYTDPGIHRILAGQLVTALQDCTPVDLTHELTSSSTTAR
ncbi:hypothetical protein ACIQGZ_28610 [Streptomyces sp. NPDC092296]|uniref:hypothetical protein n=1 Tax=Streptomyces sp. NPDC092296 TaxID=3366012 RepID=UPI0037F18B2B